MSDGDALKAVDLGEKATNPLKPSSQTPPEPVSSVQNDPTTQGAAAPEPRLEARENQWTSTLNQFKLMKFFVLRPGTVDHAIEDIKTLVSQQEDGDVKSVWLLTEIDHWNNELERLVIITENCLLICKYDFLMFNCEQIERIPLNCVDRVSHGTFIFPQHSRLSREGEGLRINWDQMREPAFSSRWNPFAKDYPYATFTYHPVRTANEKFTALCELKDFQEHVIQAAKLAHLKKPIPGKANEVLVLNEPILIEAYVGLMSFIGNQNKLGYCLARGNIGF
ncbi:tumor protein p63-regulated gene 1 protein [Paramormyrops kingsleyae]|uniref:Tumor protein p63 regulated 1 n=1 Tax=Paramormyrops kingsleyae TaxID=1676925 RepID=A0A3B3QAX4_9TELE|nr:tumor protein p63-regulated gene 1-like protein [Paramormyrops kingsleyae]